jgi:hypothetical protein
MEQSFGEEVIFKRKCLPVCFSISVGRETFLLTKEQEGHFLILENRFECWPTRV